MILLGLWIITMAGINSAPPGDHELYVLETSREMESRGDWVLPTFNYEPRLNKPPFSYWATVMLSRLDPFSKDVQIWHGRLISLLAGLLMVLATYHAGKTLFDPPTGKLASALMLCMQGYIAFSHNARPDFLYATFCALQLFAWMYAWKADDDSARQRFYGWLGWGMAGLATLTKGPQGPIVFLFGMLFFLLCGSDRKRTLRVMRPFSGILIFCLLVLPWWFLLQQRLTEISVDLSTTQLSGSLLRNLASFKELISFYYPLNLFWLMIPVSLIFPFIIFRLWKRKEKMSAPTRILLYASATILIIFTLGGHYRNNYLLQVLPAFSIFLASAIQTVAFPRLKGAWKLNITALLLLCAVLCLYFIIRNKGYSFIFLIFFISLPLWLLFRQELKDTSWADDLFSTQLLKTSPVLVIIVTCCVIYLVLPYSNHSQWQASRQSFAESVGKTLHAGDLIIQWQNTTTAIPFYVKRPAPLFDNEAKLAAYFQENRGKHMIYAVVPKSELPKFDDYFENSVLINVENKSVRQEGFTLLKLTGLKKIRP